MAKKKGNGAWTEPQIQPRNPKPSDMQKSWKVRYEYYDQATETWKSFAEKGGINYFHTYKERLVDAKGLVQHIESKLKAGWNPVTKAYNKVVQSKKSIDDHLTDLKELTFTAALDFALSKKKDDWAKKSYHTYNSVAKYLKIGAASIDLDNKKIAEFEVPHYLLVLDATKKIRKLSPKGYNKYRLLLHGMVEALIPWNIVKLNYIHHIPTKQTIKVFANRPPTKDERELIIGKIKSVNRDYYRFLCVLYGCALRPKEITRLKIRHLHRKEQVFRIIPDKKEENSKVSIEREIQIPDWLLNILSELNLHSYDPDYYIFSSKKDGMFLPGPTHMHANTPTNYWFNIVKDKKNGLGLEVNQYGLKKLSGDDMIKIQRMEGTDKLLQLPQSIMGHQSAAMTEHYVREHLDIMKDVFKKKMPEL